MFYDYYCPECGYEQEEMHGMTETPEVICPKCSCKMKIKINGGVATHFKGSGWVSRPRGDSSLAKRITKTVKAERIK